MNTRIIYSSRTHSQLDQVKRELKRTPYSSARTVTLASRDNLCVHEHRQFGYTGERLNRMCRTIKHASCSYYRNRTSDKFTYEPLEIEELYKMGK